MGARKRLRAENSKDRKQAVSRLHHLRTLQLLQER